MNYVRCGGIYNRRSTGTAKQVVLILRSKEPSGGSERRGTTQVNVQMPDTAVTL